MKLHYYPETDSLYIELNAKLSLDSQEIADGLVIDFDADGNIIGIDIDRAPLETRSPDTRSRESSQSAC